MGGASRARVRAVVGKESNRPLYYLGGVGSGEALLSVAAAVYLAVETLQWEEGVMGSRILGSIFAAIGLVASGLADEPRLVPISEGWAQNSVNTVVFRQNSVVSHGEEQYAAFYDAEARVVLAKRHHGEDAWELQATPYRGNVRDAHNAISLMVDGEGYLHVSWDHHVHPLRYARSVAPGSLTLTEKLPMTGQGEGRVTYPQFYRLPDGDLIFLYRDGASGNGNLAINHYETATQTWTRRHASLIDGEGQRNAYWQATVDEQGVLHVSWVWRETGDVSTNHDLGYARSLDGGRTWQTSGGGSQTTPITQANAEYAAKIPVGSELINQTSMAADASGRPYIASYWRPEGSDVPQYQLVYHDGTSWNVQVVSIRVTPFSLSGFGTRSIPISRPQVVVDNRDGLSRACVLFRDTERGSRVSVAISNDVSSGAWRVRDLTDFPVDRWEPTYDTERWRTHCELHLFVQRVGQGDAETVESIEPQQVSVLEWCPE